MSSSQSTPASKNPTASRQRPRRNRRGPSPIDGWAPNSDAQNFPRTKQAHKRMPESVAPSVMKLHDALYSSAQANLSRVSPAVDSNIAEITRRLSLLEKKGGFTAATFGAASYSEIADRLGVPVQCRTPEECGDMMSAVIRGSRLHPPRIGAPGQSMVLETVCSTIYTVPASGTLGFTDGDIIIVQQPTTGAHRGVVILAKTPGDVKTRVLAYAAPDRDPEQISSRTGTLFAKMDACAPVVIGGTVVATSQMFAEGGVYTQSLASALPGKSSSISLGRNTPPKVIGSEVHELAFFNAGRPLTSVWRTSGCEALNPAIVSVPNASDQPITSGLTADPFNPLVLVTGAADAATARSAGFNTLLASAWGTNFLMSSATIISRLSTASPYLIHMLYGDVELSFKANFSAAGVVNFSIITENGGGTTSTVGYDFDVTQGECTLRLDTRGPGSFSGFRGRVIRDITTQFTPTSTATISLLPTYSPEVKIKFFEVPSDCLYMGYLITGARAGYQIAVHSRVHTEVLLTPASTTAQYLQPTEEQPYDPDVLPHVVNLHTFRTSHGSSSAPTFSAASFMDTAKKLARIGGRAGHIISPLVPAPYQGALSTAATTLQRFGKMRASEFGADSAYRAAGFSSLPPPVERHDQITPFSFPAVNSLNDFLIVPVVQGFHSDSTIASAFPSTPVGYGVDDFEGRSGTLALLLAALSLSGFPISPGAYSGEVTNASVAYHPNRTVAMFTVLPVAEADTKIAACAQERVPLLGYFADGWYSSLDREYVDFEPTMLLGESVLCSTRSLARVSGYPRAPLRITAIRFH